MAAAQPADEDEKFQAFRRKMVDEGLKESCIKAFKYSFDKLQRKETGFIRYVRYLVGRNICI